MQERKLCDEISFLFFFFKKGRKAFPPSPTLNPFLSTLFARGPLVVSLTSWAALRNGRKGSSTRVSVFAFKAIPGKKGPIHTRPRQHEVAGWRGMKPQDISVLMTLPCALLIRM